ncbi:hypothetical protein MASR2M48_35220 [Spirochaetota bacterium]
MYSEIMKLIICEISINNNKKRKNYDLYKEIKDFDLERLMKMETKLYNFHATKDDRFKRIETISKSAVEDEIKNLDLYFVISDEHYVFGFMKCIEKEIKETELVKKRKIIQILDLYIEEEYRKKEMERS